MEPTRKNILAWAAQKPGMRRTVIYPCRECVLGQFFTENGGQVARRAFRGYGTTEVYISASGKMYDVCAMTDRFRPDKDHGEEYRLAYEVITDLQVTPAWADVCFALRASLANIPAKE